MMSRQAQILLVEDNHMDITLTIDAFKEVGLQNIIHVVKTGQEALDYLFGKTQYSDRSTYPLPDIILLDLKLPGINGHEVLQQVKQTNGLKRIPVIILTSSKEEGDRSLSYDIGANSYLVKPISFEGFLDVARQVGNYWLSLNVGPPDTEMDKS